jgi:hypothetical protein
MVIDIHNWSFTEKILKGNVNQHIHNGPSFKYYIV